MNFDNFFISSRFSLSAALRRLALVLICAGLAGMPSARPLAKDQPAEVIAVAGIKFPKQIGSFRQTRSIDNEARHPGMGVTLEYKAGPTGFANIYIYDRQMPSIPTNALDPIVRTEFDSATQGVVTLAGMVNQTVELVGRYGTGTPTSRIEFLCAEFVNTTEGRRRRTFLYLTGAHGKFIKLRVTLATNDPKDLTARNFADAVARAVYD